MMSNRLHEKPTASTAVVAAMLVPVLVSALLASCACPRYLP